VLGFAFVLGVLTAFALPAQQALFASLVEREDSRRPSRSTR
jgi:hypothetical protein